MRRNLVDLRVATIVRVLFFLTVTDRSNSSKLLLLLLHVEVTEVTNLVTTPSNDASFQNAVAQSLEFTRQVTYNRLHSVKFRYHHWFAGPPLMLVENRLVSSSCCSTSSPRTATSRTAASETHTHAQPSPSPRTLALQADVNLKLVADVAELKSEVARMTNMMEHMLKLMHGNAKV